MSYSDVAGSVDPAEDSAGRLRRPTREELARYAASVHLPFSVEHADEDLAEVATLLNLFDRLDNLEQPELPLRHPNRHKGRAPTTEEDPYNAIMRFCDVKGAEAGPLAAMRIGVKDNIAVAGVPMTCGTRHTPVAVPTEDAVVVERLLDAGATIVAKTNMGMGDNAAFGETRNPHNPRFAAGGSSSGSAAAVAAGIIDAALGTDLGGSVRIPAAWCGIVGMKATHGLVPAYGKVYSDHTLDHIGPITATVGDSAALLEAMAGGDWRDPQWVRADPVAGDYMGAAGGGVKGLRVGVVFEALEPSGCSAGTLEAFERARKVLVGLGAELVLVSVPLWTEAPTILLAILAFGMSAMAGSFGQGYGHLGRIDVNLLATTAAQYRLGAQDLPRAQWLTAEHLREAYQGVHFGRAQNLRLKLRHQIDAVFDDVDLLVTPTTVMGPFELANGDSSGDSSMPAPLDVETLIANTAALNLSGHPALTVPSGLGDNRLPTGIQLIGRRFDEHTVYRAGFAFEADSRREHS